MLKMYMSAVKKIPMSHVPVTCSISDIAMSKVPVFFSTSHHHVVCRSVFLIEKSRFCIVTFKGLEPLSCSRGGAWFSALAADSI